MAVTGGVGDATQSRDGRVGVIAAEGIGRFGEDAAEAVPSIAAAGETHSDERARESSARALTRMGVGGAAALQRLLASTRPTARRAALVVLPIDVADAAASIAAGLRDADAGVRIASLARLERPSSSPYERNLCDTYERSDDGSPQIEHASARRFIDALPASTADRLRGLLRDPDEAVRERALGAFTTFACVREGAQAERAEPIARALADSAPRVRAKAVAELTRLAVHGMRPPSSMLPVLLGAMRRESRELGLPCRVGEIGDDWREAKVRSPLADPVGRQLRLHSTGRRVREEVTMDVLRRIDVRLDQSHSSNGRIANEKVEDDHPAATGADLE